MINGLRLRLHNRATPSSIALKEIEQSSPSGTGVAENVDAKVGGTEATMVAVVQIHSRRYSATRISCKVQILASSTRMSRGKFLKETNAKLMKYELAKELEHVGFPSSEDSELHARSVSIDDWTSPHLSELIEACGDNLDRLFRIGNYSDPSGRTFVSGWCAESPESDYHGYGETPEEAVARLWLSLNAKHQKVPSGD